MRGRRALELGDARVRGLQELEEVVLVDIMYNVMLYSILTVLACTILQYNITYYVYYTMPYYDMS